MTGDWANRQRAPGVVNGSRLEKALGSQDASVSMRDPPAMTPAQALAPIQSFRDVLAGPSPDRDTPGVLWPDFETQTHARLWRHFRRVCTRPVIADDDAPDVIEEPAMYVSMYDDHFGHMVAETVPRLPQALAEAPGMPLYFTASRPMDDGRTSAMFRSVLDWLRIPPEQVRFVHRATLFRHLHVAAQAEHLLGPGPAEDYLDLLEARIAGRLGRIRPEGIAFVTRAGLNPQKGYHAAEAYLADRLQALGVPVIHPERLPLAEQMRIYAGARHLVFSEGSAMHGRQLLGRVDQHISVLRRRFRSTVAQAQLAPRCAALTYVASFGGALHVADAAGRPIRHAMASLYNPAAVIAHFEGLGVPLGRAWDMAAYRRLRDRDVLAWVGAVYGPRIEPWLRPHNSEPYLLDQLEPAGLGHLRAEVADLMRRHPSPAQPDAPAAGGAKAAPQVLAFRGEAGIDLFLCPGPGAEGSRFRCIATWQGAGDGARLVVHDPQAPLPPGALARIAAAAQRDPLLAQVIPVPDGTGRPRAYVRRCDPARLDAHRALFDAWEQADAAGNQGLAALEQDPGLVCDPGWPMGLVQPLHDFNRLALGQRAARRVGLAVTRRLNAGDWPAPAADGAAQALRLLGDLCSRAGQHGLALACHETAIRAGGDSALCRRKAIEAAEALRDRAARDAHLAAYARRWRLPPDLARLLSPGN